MRAVNGSTAAPVLRARSVSRSALDSVGHTGVRGHEAHTGRVMWRSDGGPVRVACCSSLHRGELVVVRWAHGSVGRRSASTGDARRLPCDEELDSVEGGELGHGVGDLCQRQSLLGGSECTELVGQVDGDEIALGSTISARSATNAAPHPGRRLRLGGPRASNASTFSGSAGDAIRSTTSRRSSRTRNTLTARFAVTDVTDTSVVVPTPGEARKRHLVSRHDLSRDLRTGPCNREDDGHQADQRGVNGSPP